MGDRFSDTAADIIIPVHNQYAFTRNLLESIYRYANQPFHLYVIDSASTDETIDLDKIYTRNITVIHNRDVRGWSATVNQGIQLGQFPYVILMSNNVEISQGWPGNMISFLDTHPRIGAVGPLSSSPDHWQCVDRVREKIAAQIPHFLTEDLHERNRILNYHFNRAGILVEGTLGFFCVALKRRTIEAVGLLDEEFSGSVSGGDYCRRLRKAGYVLGLSLDAYVLQHASALAGSEFHEGDDVETPSNNVAAGK
jgi:GT2 family glycosyltransferase